jgi:hypothetical protein
MSSKLGITILLITVLGNISTIPAQATSLKNIPFEQKEEFKGLDNKNSDASNQELLKIPLNILGLFSKNHEVKNELEYRLLEETQSTTNKLKEANQVTQETINGQAVYFYKIKNPVGTFRNNINISENNQIRWKLPVPKPRKKIPEPATGVGLVALSFFTVLRLKKVQKF